MRLLNIAIICCALVPMGCEQSNSQKLTPEQSQQVQAAHAATIATCERLLGRGLTDSEKQCIHEDFKDGRLVGSVAAPLSETLKKRQAELLEQAKKTPTKS